MAVSAPLQSLDLGFTENKSIGVQLDQNDTLSAVFTTHSSLSVGGKKKEKCLLALELCFVLLKIQSPEF